MFSLSKFKVIVIHVLCSDFDKSLRAKCGYNVFCVIQVLVVI